MDLRPSVAVSYSHNDDRWAARVVRALEAAGLDAWYDRRIDAGEAWHPSVQHAISTCQAVVCLITPSYLRSEYVRSTEIPIIQSRRAASGLLVVPILIEACAWRDAAWLQPTQMDPPDGRSVVADFVGQARQEEFFRGMAERLLARLQRRESTTIRWREPVAVELGSLQRSTAHVFGRERLFDDLDNAFNSPDVHIVSLVGPAGVGKSTAVAAWLDRLGRENYRHAVRVFGWAFQRSSAEVDADGFVNHLYRWFGDTPPLQVTPWERGRRLARLVRREATLLVLDGIDPLLEPFDPGSASIQDPAIAKLLAELARDNRGLVVVTSREPIAELAGLPAVRQIQGLEMLEPRAGAAILAAHGVEGERLEDLSAAVGNHALAVALLAGYLTGCGASEIDTALAGLPPPDPSQSSQAHPHRVLRAFEARFGDSADVQLLRLIGLCGGSAPRAALAAVCRARIPGLSDHLAGLADGPWARLVARLRTQNLVTPAVDDASALESHPVVWTFFSDRIRSDREPAWKEGHEVLYRYHAALARPPARGPDELKPLYKAVRHGCAAGLHQEALDGVFWTRILRGNEQFSWRALGLIQSDLRAIACFFATPWSELAPGIRDRDAGFVIGQAALYLGMSGRLTDAVSLFQQSLERDVAVGHVLNASVTAGNLARTVLLLGDNPGAIEAARRCVEYADRAADANERRIARTHLGTALFHAWRLDDAEAQFREAEAILASTGGGPLLYGSDGREYGEVLIARGRWSDALSRATANVARREADADKASYSHDLLAAARANLTGLRVRGTGDVVTARRSAEAALAVLRDGGQLDVIPLGLLARADVLRFEFRQHEALDDIDETLALCRRSGIRLHEVRALAMQAKILAELGQREAARASLQQAVELAARFPDTPDPEFATLHVRLGAETG